MKTNVFSLRRLLIIAAVFHVVVTLSIYGLARQSVFPGTFDTNGIAISFAPDGIGLREEVDQLGETLRRGRIREWVGANSGFHIKLYSISFALLAPLVGPNILSAEPVNLFCYLAILVLVFKLGLETFNRRVGVIAATVVALWPSLLLHTTQLLKDPQFILGLLCFVLVILNLLSRELSWPRALLTAAGGVLIAVLIWLARDSMGALPVAIAAIGIGLLIVRQLREKRFLAANLVGMALVIAMSAGVTQFVPKFKKAKVNRTRSESIRAELAIRDSGQATKGAQAAGQARQGPWQRMLAQITRSRYLFALEYPEASSNIDADLNFSTTGDLVRYLPRAAVIGFFAPFPNMWFLDGNRVGSAGRRLSGLEMIAVYLVEVLAVVGLFSGLREPGRSIGRQFSIWLLPLVVVLGMVTLGLVVVNVGALYRLRYVFVVLLIIPAAQGAVQTFKWLRRDAETAAMVTAG